MVNEVNIRREELIGKYDYFLMSNSIKTGRSFTLYYRVSQKKVLRFDS
jgi:hypothetical protein